ncbi:hypothetical protein [Granulicella sp. WH15]|uniref:hypothetical protein n=1 Tax=Granulicella sp. WH15 TaxID=2602070 RepID=UPI0013A58882|nr:hypothetical protein [Granulicella sp. WH15]
MFLTSAARQKTIHRQTEQNEASEGGEAGVAGAASAKHAPSFGAQSALVPNGLHKGQLYGPSTLANRSGAKPRVSAS